MSSARDGKRPDCRACVNEARAQYRRDHPDRAREAHTKWYLKNKDDPQGYFARNEERIGRRRKEYYEANKGEYLRRYYERRARLAGVEREPYSRQALFERWGHRCCYCDAPATDVEHITPLCKGGGDVLSNVTVACGKCNGAKGAKTLAEWAGTF